LAAAASAPDTRAAVRYVDRHESGGGPVTSNPDDPERNPYEFPSLERSSDASQPYAPVDPAGNSVPPPDYSPGAPPPAFPPPYHGGVPYDPYAKPQTTNAQAIGALVSSIAGMVICCCGVPSLIGLILGIVAMNETRRTGQAGHGLALAAVIIGGIGLLFFIGFWLFFIFGGNRSWEVNF
jgi:hypothetical protein